MAKGRHTGSNRGFGLRNSTFTIIALIIALGLYLYDQYLAKQQTVESKAAVVQVQTKPAGQPVHDLRIVTYNMQYLGDGAFTEGNRIDNIKKVLDAINGDVIGMQEVGNRATLELVYPKNEWNLIIDDQSTDRQNPAFAIRKEYKILGYNAALDANENNFIAPERQYEQEFPNRRDGLVVEVQPPSQSESIVFVNIHAKSRVGGRNKSDNRREGHGRILVDKLKSKFKNKNVVLLGDFNDSPDDASLNILETGDPNASPGNNDGQGKFLINTCEPLWAANMVSYGAKVDRVDKNTGLLNVVFNTARNRNNDLRGTGTNTGPILFDQILVSAKMKNALMGKSAVIFTEPVALQGVGYTRPSDHLPVYLDVDYSKLN